MMRLVLVATSLFLCACTIPEPAPAAPPAWQCDAEGARSLVGSHRGAIMFPADAVVRFVCTECAMTRDYRSDRLTVFYDAASGVIENVRCV